MKLKNAYLYQLISFFKPIVIFYSLAILISLVPSIVALFQNDMFFQVSGWDVGVLILMFIMGYVSINEDFPMHLQNSVSRKTYFFAKILSVLSASAIIAVIYTAINLFVHFVFQDTSTVEITSFFELIYFKDMEVSVVSMCLWNALFIFAASVFVNMWGAFMGAVFYRTGKLTQILLTVGVIGFFLVILPMVDLLFFSGELYAELFRFLDNVFGISEQAPWKAAVSFGVLFALSTAAGWLAVRNAPLKNK